MTRISMVTIDDVRKLFLDPATDSSEAYLRLFEQIHSRVRAGSDFGRPKRPIEPFRYADLTATAVMSETGTSLDDVVDELVPFFDGAVRWHSPRAMYNVTPPPVVGGAAAASVASLYNPNIAWDIAAGKTALAEQLVIAQLAGWVGWDPRTAGGAFTFGGKGTNLAAIKMGLRQCQRASSLKGVSGDTVVFSTKACHPCHVSCCDWLGIGTERCERIDTDSLGVVDLAALDHGLRAALARGARVACILISGGTTMDMMVDSIDTVADLRDAVVRDFDLDYVPHLHVDTVVGWPWMFFTSYEFETNPLDASPAVLESLRAIADRLRNLHRADSFGVDFHKTGFCSYQASALIVREKNALMGTFDNDVVYGNLTAFRYTFENSRGGQAPLAAYTTLRLLGVQGFQRLLAHLMEMTRCLRTLLQQSDDFRVVNEHANGLAIVFEPVAGDSGRMARDIAAVLRERGEPFFIDVIPSYATGSTQLPRSALKAYVMSPFAEPGIMEEFVSLLTFIKRSLERDTATAPAESFTSDHPLKTAMP